MGMYLLCHGCRLRVRLTVCDFKAFVYKIFSQKVTGYPSENYNSLDISKTLFEDPWITL